MLFLSTCCSSRGVSHAPRVNLWVWGFNHWNHYMLQPVMKAEAPVELTISTVPRSFGQGSRVGWAKLGPSTFHAAEFRTEFHRLHGPFHLPLLNSEFSIRVSSLARGSSTSPPLLNSRGPALEPSSATIKRSAYFRNVRHIDTDLCPDLYSLSLSTLPWAMCTSTYPV